MITPTTSPPDPVTGKWWTPSANICTSASPASASERIVIAGNDAIVSTGASSAPRTATTRERRSRSVAMPHPPRIGIRIDETRSDAISLAASAIAVSGPVVTAPRRTSVATVR